MTTTCSQVATLTTTEVLPTGSTFINVTSVLTTLPDTTFTTSVVGTTCIITGSFGASSCFTTFLPSTGVIPGDETFTQVTVTETVDSVFTTTRTLFDSVCTTIAGNPPPVGNSRSVSSKPGSSSGPVASPSPRSTPSLTSPTASATTTADAAVVSSGAEKKSTSIGPIIGGAVGGVVVVAILLWLGWKFFYKPMKASKAHNEFWDGKEEKMSYAAGAAGVAAAGAGGAAAGGQAASQNPFCGEPQHAPANANVNNANANSNGNGNGPESQQQQAQQQAQQQQAQQQQADQQQNQWPDKPHRLPKKAEEMLQGKMDEWMYGAGAAAGAGMASGPHDHQQQQQQQQQYPHANNAAYPQSSPHSPPRPTSTGSFTSQPSFGAAGAAGVGAYNQQNQQQQQQQWTQAQPVSPGQWNAPAPYPVSQQPQYNAPASAPVLGQTVYPQQAFTPPTAHNYQGYAEPSR